MRRTILAGMALALLMTLASGCGKQQAGPALSVNEVGSDPGVFTGTITVTGVTAGFAARDATLFGLMDKKELQCQTPNCKKLLIPVRYQGKLPDLGDEVLVTGSFVDTGGGYLFAAQKIEVVRNHRLGG